MIVLNYHELAEASPPNAWCLTHKMFDEHLALYGDRLISPSSFLKDCSDPKTGRTDAVLLTFDDGFLSDYTHVYTRYVKSGRIPGFMSFIPVEFVGSPGRMNWKMIEELGRDGVAIGSHGMAHVDLTTASDVELDRELTVSKSMLEDRLGQRVTLFAFPYRALFPTCLGRGSEGRLHASLYNSARVSSRFRILSLFPPMSDEQHGCGVHAPAFA